MLCCAGHRRSARKTRRSSRASEEGGRGEKAFNFGLSGEGSLLESCRLVSHGAQGCAVAMHVRTHHYHCCAYPPICTIMGVVLLERAGVHRTRQGNQFFNYIKRSEETDNPRPARLRLLGPAEKSDKECECEGNCAAAFLPSSGCPL